MTSLILEHYRRHEKTIQNLFWRLIQVATKQVVILFAFVICAKLLTPTDFGLYNYVLALTSLLVLFSDFGISTATSKFVAEHSMKDEKSIDSVVFNIFLVLLSLSSLVFIFLLIFRESLFANIAHLILYITPLIFLIPLTSLYDGIYRGLRNFKQLGIGSSLAGLVSLPVMYLGAKLGGMTGALVAMSFFYLMYLLILAIGHRGMTLLRFRPQIIKQISLYGFYVGFGTLGYYLFSRVDILILGHFGYITQIASYEILNKIFGLCLVPFQIVAQVLAPNFTIFYARKDYEKILMKFRRYSLILLFCVLGFIVASLLGINWLLATFFHAYNNEITSKILLPTILIYATSIYTSILHAGIIISVGYADRVALLNAVLAIANLFLCLLFLRLYGYVGIIYATFLLNILGTIILQFFFYRKIKSLTYGK